MQGSSVSLMIMLWGATVCAAELDIRFSDLTPGQFPPGFRSSVSGQGKPGDWKIVLDTAPSLMPPLSARAPVTTESPVLAQLARDPSDEHYPLLVYEAQEFDDFVLTTHFKLVAGEVEQMAGMAFRFKDERNYYYVRGSGLAGTNFYFWKIVDGNRSPPIGTKVNIPKGLWHKLTIECRGSQIRALLNDQELIPPLGDNSFTTGKIAFWTKSDAVSHFSDVKITYTPKVIFAQRLLRDTFDKHPRLRGLQLFAPGLGKNQELTLIASSQPGEVGQPACEAAKRVIAQAAPSYAKAKGEVMVMLPIHNADGDPIAALNVIMKGFPGQTEKNAIARAMPIGQQCQQQIRRLEDFYQ